jgi:hypothetical protein
VGRVQGKCLWMLLAAACGLCVACSHSGAERATSQAGGQPGGPTAASSPATNANQASTDLVSAVASSGGGEGPVGLKFQLRQRPVAGQPVAMTLRLVANQALEHLEARFHPDEGLEITQGGDFDPQGPLEAGATVDHVLTLVPDHDGVYTVMATVTSGSAADAVSRSFVIPFVVAAAAPGSPAVAGKPQ